MTYISATIVATIQNIQQFEKYATAHLHFTNKKMTKVITFSAYKIDESLEGQKVLAVGEMKNTKGDLSFRARIVQPTANQAIDFCELALLGYLGQDIEFKASNNYNMAKTSIAINHTKNDPASWFNVTLWNKTADIANQYLTKGSFVLFTGLMELYQGKEQVMPSVNVKRLNLMPRNTQREGVVANTQSSAPKAPTFNQPKAVDNFEQPTQQAEPVQKSELKVLSTEDIPF